MTQSQKYQRMSDASLTLPYEMWHHIYDFIHPFREYKKFRDILKERETLLKNIDASRDDILLRFTARYLQYQTFDENVTTIAANMSQMSDALKQIKKKQQEFQHLEKINLQVKRFYEENPKMSRPTHDVHLSEHQYRTYWCPISKIEIKRMDNNISIRRGLWAENGEHLIEYDDLLLILNEGTIQDLVYHCEINGVEVHPRLKQQPQNQNETIQFRKELVKMAMSF